MRAQSHTFDVKRSVPKVDDSVRKYSLPSKPSNTSTINKKAVLEKDPVLNQYADIQSVKLLRDSNFKIYLVFSPSHNKKMALKLFPYEGEKLNKFYLRELHSYDLNHPHVVSVLDAQDDVEWGLISGYSYVLLEYYPYGNFFELVSKSMFYLEDVLIRTYFHQLIEGVEYLHSKGLAHMNLKLENLLLDKDFNLRICDFKFSTYENKEKMIGKGTKNFRAPEVINSDNVSDPKMADIYSCGIILFALKAGTIPYVENKLIKDFNLFELMLREDDLFWEVHKEIQDLYMDFDRDFKELFLSLVRGNPKKRPTISQIKASKWYKGPIYSQSELTNIMKQKIAKIISPVKGKK